MVVTRMPRRIPEQQLDAIVAAIARRPRGATAREIATSLGDEVPFRTLQYRIKYLVDHGRVAKEGEGRWESYHLRE